MTYCKFNFIVAKNHLSLPGHFPNNPIVPGAVIIDTIVNKLYLEKPNLKVIGVNYAKFIKAIKPEMRVDVVIYKEKNCLQFQCLIKNVPFVKGQLTIKESLS